MTIGAGAIVLAAAFVWGMVTSKQTPIAHAETAVATAREAPSPSEPANPFLTALAKIDHMPCAEAFEASKVGMGDTTNEDSPGATLFGVWAGRRMRWTDVSVPNDETTFALVQKDSQEQLGKRMCSSGQIIEIHAEKLPHGGTMARGLLLSDAGHLYRFMAGGSSGNLVAQSYARLCGMVVGNYSYPNSAGGTGHAVAIVGMFDLPQNKTAPAATAP